MRKNKGFSKIILIIITLIVLGGGYYLWQNQVSTPPSALPKGEGISTSPQGGGSEGVEDWKTYRNDEYGFEFKYPKAWGIIKVTPPVIVGIAEHPDWGGATGGVYVSVIDKQTVAAAKLEAQKMSENNSNTKYSVPEITTVAGITTIKRSYQPYEIVPRGIDYIFPEKGLVLTLTNLFTDNKEIDVESSEIQQAVLTSFRFTK